VQRLRGRDPAIEVETIFHKADAQLLRALKKLRHPILVLDERGALLDSEEFARLLFARLEEGSARLSFCIGAADGLPQELRALPKASCDKEASAIRELMVEYGFLASVGFEVTIRSQRGVIDGREMARECLGSCRTGEDRCAVGLGLEAVVVSGRLARVLLTEQIYRAQEIRRKLDRGEALAIIEAILPESSCVIQAHIIGSSVRRRFGAITRLLVVLFSKGKPWVWGVDPGCQDNLPADRVFLHDVGSGTRREATPSWDHKTTKAEGKRKTPSIEAVGKDPMGAFRDVPTAQTAPEDEHKALKDIGGTMISLVFWAVFIRAIVIEEHYLPYQEMRTSLMMEGMGGSQIHVFPTD
ncbi:rlmH, partial [Symbiodinium necroappetens]